MVDSLDTVSNNLCSIIDYAEACLRFSPSHAVCQEASMANTLTRDYMSQLNSDQRVYLALNECLELDAHHKFLCEEGRRVGLSLKSHYEKSGIGRHMRFFGPASQVTSFEKEIMEIGAKLEQRPDFFLLYRLAVKRHRMAIEFGHSSYASLMLQVQLEER